VQTTNINKVSTLIFYQLTVSLLVIDFTNLEGRDGDIAVKELAAVDFQGNRVASYLFKRPYGWEEVPMFNARINEAIEHGCNWNDGVYLIQSWRLWYIARHHPLLQSIASAPKKHNL